MKHFRPTFAAITRLNLALVALVALFALFALSACANNSPPQCRGTSSSPAVSAAVVCAKLVTINCPITACTTAYANWRATVEPATFDRVTACYMAATDCREVNDCSRACGNGGPVVPRADGSVSDVSSSDVAAQDVANDRPLIDVPAMIDRTEMDVPAMDAATRDVTASDASVDGSLADSASDSE